MIDPMLWSWRQIVKSYLSDLDYQYARERYNDQLRVARQQQLIREAQAARKPAALPQHPGSLIARLRAALLTRRLVRA
jgi:hypothetical protein